MTHRLAVNIQTPICTLGTHDHFMHAATDLELAPVSATPRCALRNRMQAIVDETDLMGPWLLIGGGARAAGGGAFSLPFSRQLFVCTSR